MKINSPYLDVLYEAQPDCKTIQITVGDWSEKFAALHGGLRMISTVLPDTKVGNDYEVQVRCDGNMQVGKIVSRRKKHEVLGIEEHAAAKESCLNKAQNLPVFIQWFATWRCNYTCHYCWQETVRDSYRKSKPATKSPTEWSDAILRLMPDEIVISGGEPTTLPGIIDIVQMIGSVVPIQMTSNLGKSFKIEDWKKRVSPEQIQCITFSFHPTQQSWEDYSSKLREFASIYGGQKVAVELVMHPNQVEFEKPMRDIAHELNVACLNIDQFHQQPAIFPSPPGDYTDRCPNENPLLAENPKQSPERRPHYCSAGVNRINIDPTGDAYTCMSAIDRSKMFGRHSLGHYRPIGNVFDAGFSMEKEPVLCWETFRCSACDSTRIGKSWTPHPCSNELPLPE